jgi:hypothetical protein
MTAAGSTDKRLQFLRTLISPQYAHVAMEAEEPKPGFWFGGGNMVEIGSALYLTGRYRSAGDSRTGLGEGVRGRELVVLRSTNSGLTWERLFAFSKADLAPADRPVLSIEGSALLETEKGVHLFLSSEKADVRYPERLRDFQKAGTGVWTIDVLVAPSVEDLPAARPVPLLSSTDPRFLHVKDPFIGRSNTGKTVLGFCTHPFGWTSSNTGYADYDPDAVSAGRPRFDPFPRGCTWDVAISRGTGFLPLHRLDGTDDVVLFYDGGECVRPHEEHAGAVRRPRGYSCEELSGAALLDGALDYQARLSDLTPLAVSPHGTGCLRYVDVLRTPDRLIATWQQSQPDGSQALLLRTMDVEEARRMLT